MIKVKRSQIASIVAASFPGYKGRTFRVEPTAAVTFYDLNWSGGTRNEYVAVNLSNGQAQRLRVPAPWSNPIEGARVDLPVNVAVVEYVRFCGKDCGLRIYVRPEMMPALLPAAV